MDAGDDYWNDGAGWEPIGTADAPFRATFEGNGHVIANLMIDRSAANEVGLFGLAGAGSVIGNAEVRGVQVTGRDFTGGLVGVTYGAVRGSAVRGTVTGNSFTGGLVGASYGTIMDSSASGSVAGSSRVGGLVGFHDGAIATSAASGSVAATGNEAGGLVGYSFNGTITASHATGAVTGSRKVGGLVGSNAGSTIGASYATGAVTGTDELGGLVGYSSGAITVGYATGLVTGTRDVGGLVGKNSGTITAGYATGAVMGSREFGGLVGWNSGGTISASYARGAVGTGSNSGGLIGRKIGGTVTVSYWDTETSGQTTSEGGTGQTTSALQEPMGYSGIYAAWNVDVDGETGSDDPWDFGTASQYPVLQVDVDGDGTATWREFGPQRSNSAPVFTDGPTTTRAVDENTAAGEPIGLPVAATDGDDDTLTYMLGGTHATEFDLDPATGQLKTLAALDYEMTPAYEVTIEVSDGHGGRASITVMITVGDVVDTPPPAPENVVATPAATSVALSWDAVAGATTYRVEYRVRPAATETETATWTTDDDMVATTTHTVDELTCGTAYEFRVSAYGDGVAHTGDWGEATTPVPVATTACAPPTPANLTATPGVTSVALSWDAVAGATTYRVEYRVRPAATETETATWTTDDDMVATTTHTVDELICGTAYEFRVSAYGDGVAHTEDWGEATTPVPAATTACAPPAPENLTATPGVTGVALNWDAVAGATTYRVEYRVRPAATETEAATWTTDDDMVTTTTHTVDELTCGTAYEFRVSAYGDGVAHTAAWSAASAPQAAFPALMVVDAALTKLAAGTLRFSWAYGGGCAGIAPVVHYFHNTEVYADGTEVSGEGQSAAGSPQEFSALLQSLFTGSPLVRFTVTQLQVKLDADSLERLTFTFDPPLSVEYNQPPAFGQASYEFTVAATAAEDAEVGRVGATDPNAADQVTYTITGGNTGDAFAIDASSGAITVAATLDDATTPYTLTVQADDGNGGQTTVTVTVTVVAANLAAAPTNLTAGTVTGTSVPLSWDAVTGAAKYRVEYRLGDPDAWTVDDDSITGTSHTVDELSCGTSYEFRVSAYGDGVAHGEDWGDASTPVPAATSSCMPAVTVSYGQTEYRATEGAADGVMVRVRLNKDAQRPLTIPLTVTLQGGAEAADYSGVPASVSFSAGETSTSFVVVAADDAVDDDGESLLLGLGDLPALVAAGTVATTHGQP